ncbi:Kinesin-6 [Hexamita inflata]|uniref:Kinesin-6 n=1 Tax=Hexamita inflata TaxID=28002 RepID=A0AA86NII9_9EUKA|nr:Kinesin-6 [Hexamita inflata]CAI9972106.1 Kinesin-6 [Hexamita inflata]
MSVQVACRVRPILNTDSGDICVQAQNNQCMIVNESSQQVFQFDAVFGPDSTQDEVFQQARPVIDSALQGVNSTIFSFGATCAGKSYTIFGPDQRNEGIIPRTISYIFQYIQQNSSKSIHYMLSVSFLEIYLERVRDLLNQQKNNLQVFDSDNPVPEATEILVYTPQQVQQLVDHANAFKVMAPNKINQQSSRSHCILILKLVQRNEEKNSTRISKLFLADLAGSEKISRTEAQGLRLSEAKNINRSLLALGKVVNSLTSTSQRQHIPYRDSKLTRLLKCSLGGNAKTLLIVHISPTEDSLQESLSTLLFASRAQNVKNNAQVNEYFQSMSEDKLLSELMRARDVITQLTANKPVNQKILDLYTIKKSDQDFINKLGTISEPYSTIEESNMTPFVPDRSEQMNDQNNDKYFQYKAEAELLREIFDNNQIQWSEPIYELHDICSQPDDIFGIIQTCTQVLKDKISSMRLNVINSQGQNPLTFALYNKNFKAAEIIIATGFDHQQKDEAGDLPLHILLQQVNYCAQQQQIHSFLNVFMLLVDVTGPTDQRDSENRYPLQLLLQQPESDFKLKLFGLMLDRGFDIMGQTSKTTQWYALMDCVYYKDQSCLEALINYLIQTCFKNSAANLEAVGFFRAFHLSIKLQCRISLLTFLKTELLQDLLVNCQFQGICALELAFQVQNFEAFEYLLKAGAKASLQLQQKIVFQSDLEWCTVLSEHCSIETGLDFAIQQNNTHLFEILSKNALVVNKHLDLSNSINGTNSQLSKLIVNKMQPNIYEEFENSLKNKGEINSKFKNLTKQLPESRINYIELLYLMKTDIFQVNKIIEVVGVQDIDVRRLKRIVELKQELQWVSVLKNIV